jgi:hypothetical protein
MPDIVFSYEMLLLHATAEMPDTAPTREYFHVEFQNGT